MNYFASIFLRSLIRRLHGYVKGVQSRHILQRNSLVLKVDFAAYRDVCYAAEVCTVADEKPRQRLDGLIMMTCMQRIISKLDWSTFGVSSRL